MGKVWRYKILELYFAGGCNKNVEDFMFKKNCKRLFSYYRDRSSIKKYIGKKEEQNESSNKQNERSSKQSN